MGQLSITAKKASGSYARIIYVVFKNTSSQNFPRSEFSLRVKEGNRVLHQGEGHSVGPLHPGEVEEFPVPGSPSRGMFKEQTISVEIEGRTHRLSVRAFGSSNDTAPQKRQSSQASDEPFDILKLRDLVFAIVVTLIGTYPVYLVYREMVFDNIGRYPNPANMTEDMVLQGAGLFVVALVVGRAFRWLRSSL